MENGYKFKQFGLIALLVATFQVVAVDYDSEDDDMEDYKTVSANRLGSRGFVLVRSKALASPRYVPLIPGMSRSDFKQAVADTLNIEVDDIKNVTNRVLRQAIDLESEALLDLVELAGTDALFVNTH